jgi:cytochrome c oxidase assembly factor CtaG/putative copper export protein
MPNRWPVLVAAAAAAGLVTWLALAAGGAVGDVQGPGLSGPTAVTWLVPTLRLLSDLAAVLTVGCLLGATVLLPGDRLVSAPGYRWLRSASWSASVWSLLSLASIPALLAEFLGRGLSAVSPAVLLDFIAQNPQAQAQLLVASLAALLTLAARVTLTMAGALRVLLLGLLAALPPALVGHAGSTGGLVAPTAVALHVLGVVLWAGGLVALLLCRKVSVPAVSAAVSRFSRLAGVLVLVVGVSGLLIALTRLPDPAQVLTTSYGLLVVIKVVAFVGLVVVGAWHRRWTMPALAAGRPAAFLRLLVVEVLLFGATVGVAVGLSRTPSPTVGSSSAASVDHEALGFPMPAPLSPGALLEFRPDLFFAALATAAVAFYVAGLRRIATADRRWPPARSGAWFAGWALVVLVTNSGLARYGAVLSSVHVVQHLTLFLAAPLLMVLARPGTLAMAVLRPAIGEGVRGPREWLEEFRGGSVIRSLTRPWVALSVYATVNYSLYLADLYELVLRSRWADTVFFFLATVSGALFFRSLAGPPDGPAGRTPRLPTRLAVLVGWAAAHIAVALLVLRGGTLLAAGWWSELQRLWGPMPIEDQHVAGRIAATFGVAMFFATVLVILWPELRRRGEVEVTVPTSGEPGVGAATTRSSDDSPIVPTILASRNL